MFAKIPLFLVFVALASNGLAFPNDESSEEHPKGEEEKHHHHGKGHKQHEKSNGHHHHGQDPYDGNRDVKFSPDSAFARVKNATEELYREIFVLASGDNYACPEVANEVHVKARAIVLLSQKLHNMLKVYPILYNATSSYALKGARAVDGRSVVDLINEVAAQMRQKTSLHFESVESAITADSFVARGKYFKIGATTAQERAEAYDKWLRDPFVATAAMNKLFYRAVWMNDRPAYKMLRALVDCARYEKRDAEKVEKIYATAVAETVKKVCPAHENRKAAYVFYQNLMNLLAEDAALLTSLYQDKEMIPGMMIDEPF